MSAYSRHTASQITRPSGRARPAATDRRAPHLSHRLAHQRGRTLSKQRTLEKVPPIPTTSSSHVLVVDDDPDIRWVLRTLLTEAGYTVAEAPDGAAALDRLRTCQHALVVLLDLQMPGVSGAHVIEAVAMDADLATRHAYLLLTANARTLPLAFVNLLTKLAVPVLAKPFEPAELLARVAEAAARLL
jgi:CheY-like chemotaxis protein